MAKLIGQIYICADVDRENIQKAGLKILSKLQIYKRSLKENNKPQKHTNKK